MRAHQAGRVRHNEGYGAGSTPQRGQQTDQHERHHHNACGTHGGEPFGKHGREFVTGDFAMDEEHDHAGQ